jgi:flagellar motor protein MotB
MFAAFSVNRLVRSLAAVMLAMVLLAPAGCRCLQKQSTAPTTVQPVPSEPLPVGTKTTEPDHYSAFRPIMPDGLQTVTEQKSEPPKFEPGIKNKVEKIVEPKPDDSAKEKIDELNQKITALESQLAETQKRAEAGMEHPLDFQTVSGDSANEKSAKPADLAGSVKLPMINKQGVTISADDLRRVHIEVTDKALFMPNTWQLTAGGEETLRAIAAEIKAFEPKALLEIEGHTDSLMGDPANPTQKHDISSIKAMTVMGFFVSTLRWDAARIGTSSHGRSRPIADNGTPEGRARNNRIEIVLRSE